MGVISPTPTGLLEKEISYMIKFPQRYELSTGLSMSMADIPTEILNGIQYQDTANTTYFASTLNQEAFHDVEFTFRLSQSPEEENNLSTVIASF